MQTYTNVSISHFAEMTRFAWLSERGHETVERCPAQFRTLGFRPPTLTLVISQWRETHAYNALSWRFRSDLPGMVLLRYRETSSRYRFRDALRELGTLVREALNDISDWQDVADHINNENLAHYAGGDVADLLIENGLFRCSECGEWTDGEEYNGEDGPVGECCIEDMVYCDDTGDYRNPDVCYCVVIDHHGNEEYRSSDYDLETFPFWHQFDGAYFDRDDAEHFGLYWSDNNQEWVDEETCDAEQNPGIAAYHSHPLRRQGYFRETSTRSDPAIGLELEVNHDGDAPNAFEREGLNWILEQDGSLDSDGVEIISPPLTLAQWRETMPQLKSALSYCNARGYNASGDYGIHITIHRRHLTPLQEARLMLFFASASNARFLDVIAQRDTLYSGARNNRSMPDCKVGAVYPRRIGEKKCFSNDKFSPLHLKENLAECRIFRSNARIDRIAKNLEFVHAIVRWTSARSCSGVSFDWRDFYAWTLDHAKDYPALVDYLCSPDGWAINGVGRVDRGYLGV